MLRRVLPCGVGLPHAQPDLLTLTFARLSPASALMVPTPLISVATISRRTLNRFTNARICYPQISGSSGLLGMSALTDGDTRKLQRNEQTPILSDWVNFSPTRHCDSSENERKFRSVTVLEPGETG